MFRTAAKIIKACFYSAIILIGVTFAVSNRGKVDLTFYPLPYVLSLPLFLFTILIFLLGAVCGWMHAGLKASMHRRAHKKTARRVEALENELGALRSEQITSPAMALPRK
jgi:uncharacterized integral membrane protein